MYKKIIYIAKDGRNFNNEYDCIKYEEELIINDIKSRKCILLFDENLQELNSAIEDTSIELLFNRAFYIYILNDDGLMIVSDYVDGAPEEIGFFVWDENIEEYIDFENKIKEEVSEIEKKYNRFNEIKNQVRLSQVQSIKQPH